MPVEFSTAAYRVGHTMVRDRYALNAQHTEVELFDEAFGTLGFSALPEELVPDWRFMLALDPCVTPHMSKAFDPAFADELMDLPVVGSNNANDRALAFRNLMRASALGVASGQAIAAEMKAKGYPLDVTDLKLGKVMNWKRVGPCCTNPAPTWPRTRRFSTTCCAKASLPRAARGTARSARRCCWRCSAACCACARTPSSTLRSKGNWRPDPCIAGPARISTSPA